MKILLKGDNVKKYLKIILTIIFIILSTICIFIVDKGTINNVSLAKTTSTSDIQLMARAINGEARGELQLVRLF